MKQIKLCLLIVFLLIKIYPANSQSLLWSRFDSSDVVFVKTNFSTYLSDYCYGYKKSSNGDIIGLHSIKGNVRFGNITYNVPAGVALIKVNYDKNMNIKSSSKISIPIISIFNFDIDENNNIYIYGIFKGTIIFTANDSIKSMHSTASNTFIVKYGNDNTFKWARTINNDQGDISPYKFQISKNNIYLLGYLNIGRLIYNGTQIYNWNYSYNLDYFISLDTSGSLRYINRIRVSNQYNFVTMMNFTIDSSTDKAYLIGGCREGGLVFTDRDTTDLTSGISSDNRIVFFMDLKSGVFYKSKVLFKGGSGSNSSSIFINQNELYITSTFNGSIFFSDTSLSTPTREFFLIKTDTNLNRKWMKSSSNSNSGYETAMAFDNYDNAIFICNSYNNLKLNDVLVNKPFTTFAGDNNVLDLNKNTGKTKWSFAYGCDSSERENTMMIIDNKLLLKTVFDGVRNIKFKTDSFQSNKPQAASFLISNDQLLNLPGKLSATALSESSIKLNWYDSTAGEEWYIIERSPNGTSNWLIIDSVAGNNITYTNTGLNTLTTYYYRIRAKCIYNTSAPGNTAQATTLAASTIPNAPSNLVAATINKNLVLTWNDNSNNENGFKIYRSTFSGGTFTLIDSVGANSTTYTNLVLASGNYCYKVKAFNSVGISIYSNESCHNFAGINFGKLPNNFQIYPQPLKESFTVSNSEDLIKKITILSIEGKIVLECDQIKLNVVNISTTNITSGSYLLNITMENGNVFNDILIKE